MLRTLRRARKATGCHRSPVSPPYLVVGLGNPGKKYVKHRHNVGFRCVDHLAIVYGITMRRTTCGRRRVRVSLGEGHVNSHQVILVKPLNFMNESGKAVALVSRRHDTPPERILVISDDLDLPLGRIRLRPGGSSGGHRGIASIISELGTQDFPRLRVGIGRPSHGDPVDYVLSEFNRDEEPVVRATCGLIERIVLCFLDEGIQSAMSTYNGLHPGADYDCAEA